MSFLENMEQIRLKHNKTSCCFKHVMIGANFNFNQALLFFLLPSFLPLLLCAILCGKVNIGECVPIN